MPARLRPGAIHDVPAGVLPMGKKAARRAAVTASRPEGGRQTGLTEATEVPVVGAREPCPCGSGRRYKACHGREAARAGEALVARPFAGLPGEPDWVALREVVPAATAPLTLAADVAAQHGVEGVTVTLSTVLPLAWPALRRADGAVLLGLQTHTASGDPSRDVAAALLRALDAEPGTPVVPAGLPEAGPRLQDVLDPSTPLQ
ncbi:MAG TPA: DUF5926 family protein, partial [Motilibacteraceae bacterium]|nr:DUF5926 family protein [Motilibacteraceae bacterium]